MPQTKSGQSRCFAYVQFATLDEAQKSLALNGMELEPEHQLSVALSDPILRKQQPKQQRQRNPRALYVSNVPAETSEPAVRTMFEPFGHIVKLTMMNDVDGKFRGFCFVEYGSEEEATRALSLDSTEVGGQPISVVISDPSARQKNKPKSASKAIESKQDASRTVHVTGFPRKTPMTTIRSLFAPIGKIDHVHQSRDSNQITLEYSSAAEAGRAVLALDGHVMDSGAKLTVSIAPDAGNVLTAGEASRSGAGPISLVPRRLKRPALRLNTKSKTTPPANSAAPAPQPQEGGGKSNADFRAMFLKPPQ